MRPMFVANMALSKIMLWLRELLLSASLVARIPDFEEAVFHVSGIWHCWQDLCIMRFPDSQGVGIAG